MRAIRYVGLPCGLATPVMIYLAETQSFRKESAARAVVNTAWTNHPVPLRSLHPS